MLPERPFAGAASVLLVGRSRLATLRGVLRAAAIGARREDERPYAARAMAWMEQSKALGFNSTY